MVVWQDPYGRAVTKTYFLSTSNLREEGNEEASCGFVGFDVGVRHLFPLTKWLITPGWQLRNQLSKGCHAIVFEVV